MISFERFDLSTDLGPLLAFSATWFGRDTYQGSARYLRWLYEEHPSARGFKDCFLAKDGDGRIVGCIHKFPLPCEIGGRRLTLASLQNLMLDKSIRRGPGILLLRRAIKGEELALAPGVIGALREVYRRFGYYEVPSYWFKRVLSPIRASAQLVSQRIGMPRTRMRLSRGRAANSVEITAEPHPNVITWLAERMQAQSAAHGRVGIAWTPELVQWRYFAPGGPRHLFVSNPALDVYCVASFGVRHGFTTARLLEYEDHGRAGFMDDVIAVLQRAGAAVALSYTTYDEVRDRLSATGWRLIKDRPSSFVIGGELAPLLRPSAAATDIGFEAFTTELV
jgi:hypothetical protein